MILDSYATHKHPRVLAWLRLLFYFNRTACSWLNAVETFFAVLTKRRSGEGHRRIPMEEAQ